jgi:renalase
MDIVHCETIIIGAGLAGLTLANSLSLKGQEALILEKSRGVGGRIATRRIDNQGLDHGALFLDFIKNKLFVGGMSSYAKSMTTNLNILKEHKVEKISKSSSGWRIGTERGPEFTCLNLILTAPAPQAIELLKDSALYPPYHSVSNVSYSKALILLMIAREIPLPLQSMELDDYSIYFMRERNLHPNGIVIHLPPGPSEIYFEEPDEVIISHFKTLLAKSALSQLEIEKYELKKWRYARALNSYPEPYVEILPRLYLCGDTFGNPIDSAHALGRTL